MKNDGLVNEPVSMTQNSLKHSFPTNIFHPDRRFPFSCQHTPGFLHMMGFHLKTDLKLRNEMEVGLF